MKYFEKKNFIRYQIVYPIKILFSFKVKLQIIIIFKSPFLKDLIIHFTFSFEIYQYNLYLIGLHSIEILFHLNHS
jgi:hypothetical protein